MLLFNSVMHNVKIVIYRFFAICLKISRDPQLSSPNLGFWEPGIGFFKKINMLIIFNIELIIININTSVPHFLPKATRRHGVACGSPNHRQVACEGQFFPRRNTKSNVFHSINWKFYNTTKILQFCVETQAKRKNIKMNHFF